VREKYNIALLTSIILIAIFFRLFMLSGTESVPPGLFSDEAINGNNAFESLETNNFDIFYRENNGREGLYIHLQAFSIALFGNTSFALRLVSALFGIATVVAVYLLTKEYLRNNRVALIAAFILSINLWHIIFSRIGFRAIMAPFFLTAALWLLYAAWNRRLDMHHTKVLIISSIGGVLFGLGFYSYIAYRAAPLILLAPIILFIREARRETSSCIICFPALFLFFAFIAIIPFGYYFAENPADFFGRTTQISVFESPSPIVNLIKNVGITLQSFFFAGDYNSRHNIPGMPQLWWPVALFFGIGILEAFRKKYVLLFLWSATMLLPVIISNEGLPHALRAIILIPPVMIFAAIGFDFIWRRLESYAINTQMKKMILLGVAMLAIAGVFQSYNNYFITWGKSGSTRKAFGGDLYETGLYLKSLPNHIPKYVITDEVDSIDFTGRPMSLQPIIFATATYLERPTGKSNIHYLATSMLDQVDCSDNCVVVPIGNRHQIIDMLPDSLEFDRSVEQELGLLIARPK
jgi:4-amino-4-deoxy-L-arabinose transferase-like glycosyltransferase